MHLDMNGAVNRPSGMTKLRIVAATVLISASLICVAFALSKGQQAAKDNRGNRQAAQA